MSYFGYVSTTKRCHVKTSSYFCHVTSCAMGEETNLECSVHDQEIISIDIFVSYIYKFHVD